LFTVLTDVQALSGESAIGGLVVMVDDVDMAGIRDKAFREIEEFG
jgi:hypothetical protein